MADHEDSAEAKACVVGPVSESSGRTSAEYATIQGRFQRIVTSLEQDGVLDKVAAEMFENKLITIEHFTKCKSKSSPESASDFMIEILRRIELEKGDFYVFVRSLSNVPALVSLYEELRTSVNPGSQTQFETLSAKTGEEVILQAHPLGSTPSDVLHTETSEEVDNVVMTLDPVPSQSRANGERTPGLPPSSAYNGSTGLMPQLIPSTAHSPSIHPDAARIDVDSITHHDSKGVFMTPSSDTQQIQSTREGELIVSGCNHRSSIIEVQDEIHDYKSRLGTVEVVLRQLKEKVDGKVNAAAASHQRLSVELYQQRRSCEFHRGKIIYYQDSLTQLKVEIKAEIKAEVKAEIGEEINEIVRSSLQEKNDQLNEMRIELERSQRESVQMNETLERAQKEMNEKLEELKVQVVQSKQEMSEDLKAKTDALKSEIDAASATQTPTHTPAAPASEGPCQCNCACNIL